MHILALEEYDNLSDDSVDNGSGLQIAYKFKGTYQRPRGVFNLPNFDSQIVFEAANPQDVKCKLCNNGGNQINVVIISSNSSKSITLDPGVILYPGAKAGA